MFLVNGCRHTPLAKPEGYRVFTGLEGSRFTVEITGGGYFSEQVQVDTALLDPRMPVAEARLFRRRGAGFSGCEYVEGIHRPGEVVYALRQGGGAIRLLGLRKTEEGALATLSGYFMRPACQTRFMLGTGEKRELFITGAAGPENSYLITGDFRHPHCSGEAVTRVYASRCDETGFFSIPVEPGQRTQIRQVEYYEKEEDRWGCLFVAGPS